MKGASRRVSPTSSRTPRTAAQGGHWSDIFHMRGIDGWVGELAVDGAGNLYAGGMFGSAGGTFANNIAKWDGAYLVPPRQWRGGRLSLCVCAGDRRRRQSLRCGRLYKCRRRRGEQRRKMGRQHLVSPRRRDKRPGCGAGSGRRRQPLCMRDLHHGRRCGGKPRCSDGTAAPGRRWAPESEASPRL